MPQCPVCKVRYSGGKSEYCPVCGWDLQPYSLVVGLVPEVLLKEKSRLDWAKSIWSRLKPREDQVHHLQGKLQSVSQASDQLQAQLDQSRQECLRLQKALQERETNLNQLQQQLDQSREEVSYLRGRLDQVAYDLEHVPPALHPREEGTLTEGLERSPLPATGTEDLPKTSDSATLSPSPPLPPDSDSQNRVNAVPVSVAPLPEQETSAPPEVLPEALASVEPLPASLEEAEKAEEAEVAPAAPESPAAAAAEPEPLAPPGSRLTLPSPERILATVPTQPLTVQVETLDPQGRSTQRAVYTVPLFRESLGAEDLEMIVVPAGTFWMGSPDNETGRDSHEGPRHRVQVPSFLMGRYPVTQSQWRAIAQLDPIHRSLNPDPFHFPGDANPVEQVSWYEAVEFCARLSRLTQRLYRLPSEAEWEYACRAGTETPFHLGETLNAEFANYDGNDVYGEGPAGLYRQGTTTVGTLPTANAFGLSDMHGNVWEWCADPWHDDYKNAPTDGSIWNQEGDINRRVLRGGSWYCLPELCRSAQRHWDEANHSGSGIGFRVVGEV